MDERQNNRTSDTQWRAIGKSVRGATHVRAELPNQDRLLWLPRSSEGPRIVQAVSDGHGGAKYFRSHIGAEYATQVATSMLEDLLTQPLERTQLSEVKRLVTERFPQKLVYTWREKVKEHVKDHPFTEEEKKSLKNKESLTSLESVNADQVLAYGATLLTVLVTEFFAVYLQLGDGDILTVTEAEETEEIEVSRPLPTDNRLIANETTSLCSKDAWHDFRVRFQVFSDINPPPSLILLATDGYANSYPDEKAFKKVGTDFLDIVRTNGLNEIEANLGKWLTEVTEGGSGDDVTLGLLCRVPRKPQTLTVAKDRETYATVRMSNTASPGNPLIVAKRGGTYDTVSEAIKHARPHDTIQIQPGLYEEGLVIDKPLKINGDGPREQIVIQSRDAPIISVQADEIQVSNLTLRGLRSQAEDQKTLSAVDISGSQFVLDQCDVTSEYDVSIAIRSSAVQTLIHYCEVHNGTGSGILVDEGAQGTIAGCDIHHHGRPNIVLAPKSAPTLRECHIHHGSGHGILVTQQSTGLIDGCTIHENTKAGIRITGGAPSIQKCTIFDGKEQGISAYEGTQGRIVDCEIYGNAQAGIEILTGSHPTVQQCKIRDGNAEGILVRKSGRGVIEDCHIFSNALAGVMIKGEAAPTIRKCQIYDGKQEGISIDTSGQGIIENCHIFRNALPGVRVTDKGCNPQIQNCEIYDGQGQGILIEKNGSGRIWRCQIYGNVLAGVEIAQQSPPKLWECRIYSGKRQGILVREGGMGSAEGCHIWDNVGAGIEIESKGSFYIESCKIYNTRGSGVIVSKYAEGRIEGCEIYDNLRAGVELRAQSHATIHNCQIKKNECAIFVYHDAQGIIEDSDLTENTLDALQHEDRVSQFKSIFTKNVRIVKSKT